jgi:hypothetical protein
MVNIKNRVVQLGVLLLLPLLLAACGSSDTRTTGIVDPAPSYSGKTTQATVTAGNAESFALEGYGGNGLATSVSGFSGMAKTAPRSADHRSVRQIVQTLKQATGRLDIPGKAAQKRLEKKNSRTAKTVPRTVTQQIAGDTGGVVNYTLEVNELFGSFFGTLDFQNYSSQGVVISGKAEMLGAFDANLQQFNRITLSFKSLTVTDNTSSCTLIGSISLGFNYSTATDTLSMNVVVQDNADNQTYWFNNYTLTTTGNGSSQSQSISGRYYNPKYGYVDLSTLSPLVAYYQSKWPYQGVLRCAGQQDTWLRLSFSNTNLTIEADTDGNGQVDWQTQQQINTLPPANIPPVANAGPDQTVTQWNTVQLDGSASSDANGDHLSYYWSAVSYPPGSYPALTGSSSATPSFAANQTGTYRFQLSVNDGKSASTVDTVDIVVTPSAGSTPNLLHKQWQYGLYGTYIGNCGLLIADLDGDGNREIIAGASVGGAGANSIWYIVRKNSSGSYEQIWQSKQYGTSIVQIILADMNGDGKDDIAVGLADGTIYLYDGPTRQEIGSLKTTSSLTALALADLDGDGKKEFITSDGIGIAVYAADGSGLLWSLASGGGNSIAVGNVDADAALEIVTTTTGGKGYVIDGVSHAIQWEYINGFGARVALADLDGDGMQEIVGAAAWYKITVFDADRKSPAWEISTNLDISALVLTDTDGDGIPEIVYGDAQWGMIHAVDARTHVEKWVISNPSHGVSGIAIGDVDQDGQPELLWGAGGSSSGADHLYIADPLAKVIKWQSMHVDGPLSAVAVGDVDDDGEDEIVMVSFGSDSGYAEGVIHIFNARTHALEYQGKLGISDWMGVRSVKIGDVDNDGKTEFVVTTGNLYDGVIQVYDGATHTLKQQSVGYNGNYFTALAIGDVDGDGKTEIVAGQGKEHTGATGSYLIVFDGATLQEKWRSVDLGTVYDIKLADLDGDGHIDICASVSGTNRLVVFDGVTHDLKLMLDHPAMALTAADVDGAGFLELLAGRTDGKIDVFDGKTFVLKKSVFTFGSSSINALRIADLDGDGIKEWLLASIGSFTVLDGQNQGLKWRTTDLTWSMGAYNHLEAKDINGDGKPEIVAGDGVRLYQFGL